MLTAMKRKNEQNFIGMWNGIYFDIDHSQLCCAQIVEAASQAIAPSQSLM